MLCNPLRLSLLLGIFIEDEGPQVTKKLQLSVLCGGQSTEHVVSVRSAKNIVAALDKNKYEISVIYITQPGKWWRLNCTQDFLETDVQALLASGQAEPITLVLGDSHRPWQSLNDSKRRYVADCVFPVLHGTYGEDGTLQGVLDFLNVPYVGADVLGSAICMEKDITKQRLRAAGIKTADWHTVVLNDSLEGLYEKLSAQFGQTALFVKPTSLGSSVATLPVNQSVEFDQAVQNALRYDKRVMVEPRIRGREIECAVLGNEDPVASLPGEIILSHDYYSYEAKYEDPEGATTVVPAKLPRAVSERVQEMAVESFKLMRCSGMARVDFFVVGDDVYVNELNTIPGFTDISMYPTMWEASGMPYANLLDKLVELAMERYRYQQTLTRIYSQESE